MHLGIPRAALIAVVVALATGVAGGFVSLHADAPSVAREWSVSLLHNGSFSDGQTPWERSTRWSDARPEWQPTLESDALVIPLRGRTATCADYTGVAIQQRIDIDDQRLQHDLRLTARVRVEAIETARVGLAVAVYG